MERTRYRCFPAKVGAVVWQVVGMGQVASNTAANEEAQRFRAFLTEDWKRWMQEHPEFATSVGFPGQNRRWTDDSPAGREERIKHLHESVEAMKQFHRQQLPANEQLNYDLYLKKLSISEEGLQYGGAAWGGGGNV